MASDDLTRPLGLPSSRKPGGWRVVLALTGGGALVALVLGGVWFARYTGPIVTAAITTPGTGQPNAADRTGAIPKPAATLNGGSDQPTADTGAAAGGGPIDPNAPGLVEVMPPPGSSAGLTEVGKVVIYDPSKPQPMVLASLPDHALVETGKYGPLPKVGGDGRRPLDVYARPSEPDTGNARVAIVVGGVGIDPDGTRHAINDLPGTVTLALAPYGDGLEDVLAQARSAGHEILLQVPLEPYNYPHVDPGPKTLTVDAKPAENLDRLHWLMSRITNYVGVVNYMGGLFTSETPAFAPVLADIGERGLLYLDDGSSPRSVAGSVAEGRAPFLEADMVLDTDLSAAAIDDRLRQLQTIARDRGYAIATATAFPTTIERITAFARSAADHNISVVPLSALAGAGLK